MIGGLKHQLKFGCTLEMMLVWKHNGNKLLRLCILLTLPVWKQV